MGETTAVAHGGNPQIKALPPQDRAASLPFPEAGENPANLTPDRSCTKPKQLGRQLSAKLLVIKPPIVNYFAKRGW